MGSPNAVYYEEAGKTIVFLLLRYFPGNRVWYVV